MLTRPAKSRGTIDNVPFRSSILSMIKIAMIDVNAIVIYIPTRFHHQNQYKVHNLFFTRKVNGKNYVVLFNVRDPAKPGTNLTGLYELLDGELKEIFVQETSFLAYYSDSHPASGVYVPVLYSNIAESRGIVYFWAKNSSQYSHELHMFNY